MNARMSKALMAILGIAALAGCLVVVVVAAGLLWLRGQPGGPDVVLYTPRYGSTVRVGEVVEVRAVARHSRGVTRVELWADGQLVAVRDSRLPEGSTPLPITQGWVPQTAGRHTLVVRAYDRSQGSGQTTTVVEAEESLPPEFETSYVVQEGDTLAGVADRYGFSAEHLAAANPGVADSLPEGTTLTLPPPVEDEGPAPTPEPLPEPLPGETAPDPAYIRPPTLLERLIPVRHLISEGDVRIQVEVLSLEVSDDFDGVYCYYALGDEAMERVPADGYFEPADGRSWAIEPWMAGERRRVFVLPEGSESLTIWGRCLGYRHSMAGGEIFDLGTMVLTSGAAEWDGSLREAMAEGRDGWFRIRYTLDSWTGYGPPRRPGTGMDDPEGMILLSHCGQRWLGREWIGRLGREVVINRFLVTCVLEVAPASIPEHADYLGFLRNGSLFRTIDVRRVGLDSAHIALVGISQPVIAGTDAAYALFYLFGLTPEVAGLPGPDETYDFQVLAWSADPGLSDWGALSNVVTIRGADIWPPPRPRFDFKHVRLTFTELDTGCLRADYVTTGLRTWGLGGYPLDAEGHPIVTGCEHTLDEWGSVSGGLDVNDQRAFSASGDMHSNRRYMLPFGSAGSAPTITLWLMPGEDLVLNMTLYDYDVWSRDDPFCDATVVHPATELEEILTWGGSRGYRGQPFISEEGDCYLFYWIEVWN